MSATKGIIAAMPQPEPGTEWRYEIKYGPEGEDKYSWLYRGNEMVATMKTYHAIEVWAALARSPAPPRDDRDAKIERLKDKLATAENMADYLEQAIRENDPKAELLLRTGDLRATLKAGGA